jgi:HPt (histidine-containing phosphotransfer) domain-containing protein
LSLNQTPQVEKQIPVIDVNALADLESLEEQGDFSVRELIETFADEAQRNLAGIRAAIASTHAEDLAREAHTLKGSGRDLGTPRLSAVCEQLERAGRTSSTVPRSWRIRWSRNSRRVWWVCRNISSSTTEGTAAAQLSSVAPSSSSKAPQRSIVAP